MIFAFPSIVPGWLTEAEGRELNRLATGRRVLEIGAYCGRSTICLAQSAAFVHVVDPFDGRATPMPLDTLVTCRGNLRLFGVADRVTLHVATSKQAAPLLMPGSFDLAFIDADHAYDAVLADCRICEAKVKPGGIICGHDYGPNNPDVIRAVDDRYGGRFKILADTIWAVTLE